VTPFGSFIKRLDRYFGGRAFFRYGLFLWLGYGVRNLKEPYHMSVLFLAVIGKILIAIGHFLLAVASLVSVW